MKAITSLMTSDISNRILCHHRRPATTAIAVVAR